MTAPKKPRTVTTPQAALTADQLRVAQLFAAMDDETQEAMLRMMTEIARKLPRHERPALRLVGGGVK